MEIKTNVKEMISKMTLEEKAGLCSGLDFWHTKPVERLGVKNVMVSDGPHGLRKQDETADNLGINDSIKAVCFPAGCATASSFDRDLLTELGEVLGNECQSENLSVLLGPAINIKRSPLCGRNFEYLSEDPLLAGEIAAAQINGLQNKNVGVSVKHFFANNQETRRLTVSSEMDERTAREIYLTPFEIAVRKAHPWTIMSSYNRFNGDYVGENKKYMTDFLRGECGFDGIIMSDWGAVNDRVRALEAGLDLEMPSSGGVNDRLIVEAVKNGTLSEEVLDTACERILNLVYKYNENRDENAVWDKEKDHDKAAEIAAQCIVLLKNEDKVLPLKKGEKVAFIGQFAKAPRYQGGGSSHINVTRVESAWDNADTENTVYADGYSLETEEVDDALIAEAVEAAKKCGKAVVFAGLPASFESEGFDRKHMHLPKNQEVLISAVGKANPNTVVVLHNGSSVVMPWVDDAKGILEAYLGGQAVGRAEMAVLYGDVNPSGHLAETFPLKLEDNPSYLYFPGEGDKSEYKEGVFVGYRYYDTKKMDVLFPFGHGLSYTDFEYSSLKLDKTAMKDEETLTVTVDVKNIGEVAGKEVVQLYVAAPGKAVRRPVHELRDFAKVSLEPGETRTVKFEISKRAFAYYDNEDDAWLSEQGIHTIEIGSSSRDIRLTSDIEVTPVVAKKINVTVNTTFIDALKIPGADTYVKPLADMFIEKLDGAAQGMGEAQEEMFQTMLDYMPLRGIISYADGKLDIDGVIEIVNKLNELQK